MDNISLSRLLPRNYSPPQSVSDLQTRLKAGEPVCFNPNRMVPKIEHAIKADRDLRTIQSQWLKELIKDNEITVPILLRHVIIKNLSDPKEELDLSSIAFTRRVVIVDSEIDVPLNLSRSTFQRFVALDGSRFSGPVNFGSTHAKDTFAIVGSTFPDGTSFEDLIVDKNFEADGAQFGHVSFKRATFGRCVLFNPVKIEDKWQSVKFSGPVDFSDCSMDGPAEFQGACFDKAADFTRLHVKKVLKFNCFPENEPEMDQAASNFKRTCFKDKAIFLAARIDDTAKFMGAKFGGEVDFERAIIGGNALFRERECKKNFVFTEFTKEAKFLMTQFQQNAEFDGAKFTKAIFERCRVKNNAYFRASICEQQLDNPSPDNKDQARPVTCLHKPGRVHFEQEAVFTGANISGDAEFTAARFFNKARFEGLRIGGVAYFDAIRSGVPTDPVIFEKSVTFSGADIGIRAVFAKARFVEEPAVDQPDTKTAGTQADRQSPIDFSLIKIGGETDFEGAVFGAPTDFNLAEIRGTVVFNNVALKAPVSFRDARLGSFEFGATGVQTGRSTRLLTRLKSVFDTSNETIAREEIRCIPFIKKVDLSGCSYSLTNPHDGKVLLDALGSIEERQPYFFLERSLRSTGNDDLADEVYLQLRKNERKRIWPETKEHFKALRFRQGFAGLLRRVLDTTWWLIANYGVRPLQLLLFSLLMILLGVLVFNQPGAVVLKEKPRESLPDLTDSRSTADNFLGKEVGSTATPSPSPSPTPLGVTQALGVSFNQFVPIVEVPSGSKWKPSETPIWSSVPCISYAAYGTIHRLAGAFLVPLGIAALTGFLHRREKPGK